jgi:hypothetical protein
MVLSVILVFIAGCASIEESAKVIMGTSTKALEEAKTHKNLAQTFDIKYPDAYNIVMKFLKSKDITPFLHSRRKRRIVAVYFNGQADTTEVGIFFEEPAPGKTKVIVTSLSSAHMFKAADLIFKELDLKTGVPSDK